MRHALPALLLLGAAAPDTLPVTAARVVRVLPHDATAFTEGLFWRGGHFFESTGEVGRSFIREVEPATGRVVRSATVPSPYFGEGIAPAGDGIVSLTWRHGIGFRWSLPDLKPAGRFRYTGEGWGLASDGRRLVQSDGTATLRFRDPATLAETGRIAVRAEGRPVTLLNELEFADGEILANVWHTDRIARIDPATGKVRGWIDLSALTARVAAADPEAVPNGIAWDAAHRRLYVTGKLWPSVFQIAPPPRR